MLETVIAASSFLSITGNLENVLFSIRTGCGKDQKIQRERMGQSGTCSLQKSSGSTISFRAHA